MRSSGPFNGTPKGLLARIRAFRAGPAHSASGSRPIHIRNRERDSRISLFFFINANNDRRYKKPYNCASKRRSSSSTPAPPHTKKETVRLKSIMYLTDLDDFASFFYSRNSYPFSPWSCGLMRFCLLFFCLLVTDESRSVLKRLRYSAAPMT